jgi:hypothetical protein
MSNLRRTVALREAYRLFAASRAVGIVCVVVFGCGPGMEEAGIEETDGGTSVRPDSGPERDDSGAEREDASQNDGGAVVDAGPMRCVGCAPCIDGEIPTPFEQTLLDLPAESWFEAPNSHMEQVCAPMRDFGSCVSVVNAWSSGAYDSVRRQMLVWGGGHADYSGNEIYAFDIRTGTWSRLTEPSVVPAGMTVREFYSQDPLPDGEPVGRHSYEGVEFLDDLGVLWAQGGSMAGSGFASQRTWTFSPAAGWLQRADGPHSLSIATAYDAPSRRVFAYASESMHVYDVDANSWSAPRGFGYPPLWPRYTFQGDKTGVIDPRRRMFWVVGGHGFRYPGSEPIGGHGNVLVWDVEAGVAVTDQWVTTGGGAFSNASFIRSEEQRFESGGGDIYNVMAPGIDYDPTIDALVAWPNAGPPYVLDLETKTWTVSRATGGPGFGGNSGGTFGRWRYLAAYNVYILVNSIRENVYFYKHTSGCGPE